MTRARTFAVLTTLALAAGCGGAGGGFDGGGAAAPFDIDRASVDSAGGEAEGSSDAPALSGDGEVVAFVSSAPNLVAGDSNGVADVFTNDDETGDTERASVADGGGEGDLASSAPAISFSGLVVAFVSDATDLVAGDSNGEPDVFVRDGDETRRVSVADGAAGAEGDGPSEGPSLSAVGDLVAFASRATNLVAGDTNAHFDVFVRDRTTGSTVRASVSSAGAQGDDDSREAAVSGDGTTVAFASLASNLAGADTNNAFDIFVRNLADAATERVSLTAGGAQANGESRRPAISADGRYVAFVSTATNLVAGDSNGVADVFVRDRIALTTVRVSVDSTGVQAGAAGGRPSISADGRFVAFESVASNLVGGDGNAASDVFVHDRDAALTARASVNADGEEASGGSFRPSISADGARVAFASNAADLVEMDENSAFDVFVAPNPLLE